LSSPSTAPLSAGTPAPDFAVASSRIEIAPLCDRPFVLGNLLTIFAKIAKAYAIVVSSPFYGFEP
jgi:hypothetical protein